MDYPYLGIIEEYNGYHKRSRGELSTLVAAEKITGKKFITIRPNFLLNYMTRENLEIDCYNDELRLAIEYNGEQHYRFVYDFHYNIQEFEKQQARDKLKKERCILFNVNLIIVPYVIKDNKIENYLKTYIPDFMHKKL